MKIIDKHENLFIYPSTYNSNIPLLMKEESGCEDLRRAALEVIYTNLVPVCQSAAFVDLPLPLLE